MPDRPLVLLLAAPSLSLFAPLAGAQDTPFRTPGQPIFRLPAGQTDRFMSEFNPAIGAVIDGTFDWSDPDGGEDGFEFDLRTFELGFNGRVDPNWWAYAVVVGSEEIEVEEAAAIYTGLGSNTSLRFGKFFADFGKLMQIHEHDLPFPDRPGVLAEYLGDELPGVGAQVDHWWATGDSSALRVSFAVFSELGGEHGHGEEEEGGPELSLGGRRDADELAFTARVTQFMDVGDSGVVQWGASARHYADLAFEDELNGVEADGLSNTVLGLDLTFGLDDESGLAGWTLGGEYLFAVGDVGAEVDDPTPGSPGSGDESLVVVDDTVSGFYVWGERRFSQFDSVGLLFGSFEHPEADAPSDTELTAFYTRNMTEFARVRLFASLLDSDEEGDTARVGLQLTAYFGPHSHGVNW